MKSQRHHWWPEVLSRYWKDDTGFIHWLLPDGTVRRLQPKNIGVIGNAHIIKLAPLSDDASVWDSDYEMEFQNADNNFPVLVDWLSGLNPQRPLDVADPDRFVGVTASDEQIGLLVEGLVSLVVRSPRNRQLAVSLAEDLRGPLPERERNALIGLNLQHLPRALVASIGTRGKFVAIYSPQRELIFGDGFFHNLTSMMLPFVPKVFAPLTPRIGVLFVRPTSYLTNPRMMTCVINANEADGFNLAVQVYAKDALFYRQERPIVTDHFRQAKHLIFSSSANPVDQFIQNIPGTQSRSRFLL